MIVGEEKLNENKLKEILEEVNQEIRIFNEKLKTIKKSRLLTAYETAIGLTTMGLCFAIPSEIAKVISALIGTYNSKALVSSFFSTKRKKIEFRNNDFYIPWKLTTMKK